MVDMVGGVLLSTNFLFFGKDFPENGVYVSPLAGLKIIIRPPRAALALGGLRLPWAFML